MQASKVTTVQNGSDLSEFIQGYWRMHDWGFTNKEALTFLKQHIELGVTTVDHAHVYGGADSPCEELFGKAMKISPSVRSEIQIITKAGIQPNRKELGEVVPYYDNSKAHILKSVDLSLKRLGTDYIDVLLIHRPDYLLNAEEVAEAFEKLKSSGKVNAFGVSNFSTSQFELLQSKIFLKLITNQVEINPFNFEVLENGTLDQLQKDNVRPMAWSCLAGGKIFSDNTEKGERIRKELKNLAEELEATIDQIVYAWIRKIPNSPLLILGSGKIERVEQAIESKKINLTHEQWYRIWSASKGHLVP